MWKNHFAKRNTSGTDTTEHLHLISNERGSSLPSRFLMIGFLGNI